MKIAVNREICFKTPDKYKKVIYVQMVFIRKVHTEINQFQVFSNNKMRAPVLSICTAQFRRPPVLSRSLARSNSYY